MQHFTAGFGYVFSSFKYLPRPGIRLYVILPIVINSVLFATVIVLGAKALDNLIDKLTAQWQWLEWLGWLLWPVFLVIALSIVFFCFSILANLVGAPFNGFLATAVEKSLYAPRPENNNRNALTDVIASCMRAESQKFIYFLIRAVPLLILFVIPMVNIFAPVIWFLFTAWMLALEYADYPMANHQIMFAEQRSKLAKKRRLAFGFGVGVLLLTMLPAVNFIAMPVAVIAATRMYIEHFQ